MTIPIPSNGFNRSPFHSSNLITVLQGDSEIPISLKMHTIAVLGRVLAIGGAVNRSNCFRRKAETAVSIEVQVPITAVYFHHLLVYM
jgi:hypothetical protein